MAPRARPRKRLTRMDAAIDAMTPLGFPEQLVRRIVKGLLEVYGGDEGWPFIEADAYKILIDTILDQPEEGDVGEERNENENLLTVGEERNGDEELLPVGQETHEDENLLPNGALGDERPGCSIVADDPGPSTLSLPPISSEVLDFMPTPRLDFIPTPPPASGLTRRRRRPCYGWISSDESCDEPDDFIMLTPAPRLKRRNLISRWDVRP
ncbi:uncharacterized protein LOC131320526 isoform X2 [Rhododendron vialii]|uniref:uncharacterized protein LOC131320526 isoform X2 n=1 Tax=Rhododendron vialii TaxID=182163 RepID=UPI00265E2AEE|nr:uncharacterized protein LOC131320526 isoform X2 [Rhododendron vialii]